MNPSTNQAFIHLLQRGKQEMPAPWGPFFSHGMALGKGQVGTVQIGGWPHCWGAQIRLSHLYGRVGPGQREGEGLSQRREKPPYQGLPVRRPLNGGVWAKNIHLHTPMAGLGGWGGDCVPQCSSLQKTTNSDVVRTAPPTMRPARQSFAGTCGWTWKSTHRIWA